MDDPCLKYQMKQSLRDVADAQKRASREKLFSLLGYNLIARRTKPEEDTELRAEFRKK